MSNVHLTSSYEVYCQDVGDSIKVTEDADGLEMIVMLCGIRFGGMELQITQEMARLLAKAINKKLDDLEGEK